MQWIAPARPVLDLEDVPEESGIGPGGELALHNRAIRPERRRPERADPEKWLPGDPFGGRVR
jgi:hypothetical protein